MFGRRGFHGFVLIAIGKIEILATFLHLQDDKKSPEEMKVGITQN